MTGLFARVRRAALYGILDASLRRQGEMPVAGDAPVVHAAGPDADRVLVVGTSAVRGLGVVANELGLGGQLARRVSKLTGRGVDIELAGSLTLTARKATALLLGYDLSRFDAVILMIGAREAVGLGDVTRWRHDVAALLMAASIVPQVFVVGIPQFGGYLRIPAVTARAVTRRVDQFNEQTKQAAAALPGIEFVQFLAGSDPGRDRYGTALYEAWAESLAPVIASGLDPLLHALRSAEPIDEGARQRALDALGVIDSDSDEEFDRIARAARDLLGASGAAITFLDHHRQWIKAAASMSRSDTPRDGAFCDTAIRRSQLFVVEDAALDESFAEHPWVIGEQKVRFYAGYPLEAPDGVRVGALCIVDTKPRHFSRNEAALLRELALSAQALLWAQALARRSR